MADVIVPIDLRRHEKVRANIDLVVCGGSARPASYELVGPMAEQALANINLDVAVLGVATVVLVRKVAVCHKTGSRKHPYVTLKVAQSSVKAHLRHGDAFGSCTTKTVKALKVKAAKAKKARLAKLKAKKHHK